MRTAQVESTLRFYIDDVLVTDFIGAMGHDGQTFCTARFGMTAIAPRKFSRSSSVTSNGRLERRAPWTPSRTPSASRK